jgi:hypothetical protein
MLPNNTMLLVIIEKFENNLVLVNVNKFKPYKYMEFKVQKQEQQMPKYLEQSASGVHAKKFDMEKEDENYEIQKPHMWSIKDEEQMEDLVVNIILIFDLQMTNKFVSNNCRSEGFGMQRFEDDLLTVSTESTMIFTQPSRVLAQSLDLLAQLTEKSVQLANMWSQSVDELTQSIDEWAQLTKGIHSERGGANTSNRRRLTMWSNQKMNFIAFIHNDGINDVE